MVERDWKLAAPCTGLKYANDDTKILVVTADGKVTVYNLAESAPKQTMQVKCYLPPKSSFSQALAPEFSPDGRKLFVRTDNDRVRIFDTSNGEQLGKPILTGTTFSIALSPNQTQCAAGGDSYARLQSIKWNQDVPSFIRHANRLSHDDAVTNLAFGGNKQIVTAGRDRLVHLWSADEERIPGGLLNERGIPLATITHTADVVGILFPNNGNQLVTFQRDGLIRVWQLPSFDPPGYVIQGTRGGTTLKMVDAERWLIAGSTHWGSKVINASLRRLRDGVAIAETPLGGTNDRGHLLDAAITIEQDKLVSLHANPARSGGTMVTEDETAGRVQVRQIPDGRLLGPPFPFKAEPRSVVMHPSKAMAAVLLVNMDIVLIDLAEPTVAKTLVSKQSSRPIDMNTGVKPSNLHNGSVQFSPNGELLFAWGIGKGFSVWDWQNGKQKFSTDFADDWRVRHLAVSPRGGQIAVANDETNRVAIIDSNDGQIVREFEHATKICSVEFSPVGNAILTACNDGRARIISVSTDDSKTIDLVHNKKVLDACYSPDGASVATLTSEMRVYLWRVRDRQWSMKPMPVPKGTQELLFSPNSQYLITMGFGNELRVLDLGSFDGTGDVDLQKVSMLGELLSAKSIGDSGIISLTSEEWLERWRAYRGKFLAR